MHDIINLVALLIGTIGIGAISTVAFKAGYDSGRKAEYRRLFGKEKP